MTWHKLVRYLCIFVLLFAQQAAYTHAAWHASGEGSRHERKHDASFQDKLCGLHGAFCEVLGALPSTAAAAPIAAIAHSCPSGAVASCIVLPLFTPPSRGPPISC